MNAWAVKAVGDWELEVLGVPFGGPRNGKDAQGEYFSAKTQFHEDKFGLPPVVYYHGWDERSRPSGSPEYIGKAISRWVDERGVWFRVVLDKASAYAKRVWDAAKSGTARASSGSIPQLVRRAGDGWLREWPVGELSLLDATEGRQPVNSYAVAFPALKAVYHRAGLHLPDIGTEGGDVQADATGDKQRANVSGTLAAVNAIRQVQTALKGLEDTAMGDELDVATQIKLAVEDAMKAQAAATAAQKAEEDRIEAEVQRRTEAAKAELEKEAAKGRRLPGGGGIQAPYVAQYADTWKYDNLEVPDLAVMIGVLDEARRQGRSRGGVTEAALKALAIRIVEEKDDNGVLTAGRQSMKAMGLPIKANELNQSTLANYGDEWVGTTYSTALWERIRHLAGVVARIPTIEVPQGSESVRIPLEGTPPTFYKVAQASAQDANPGQTTRTITTAKMGTGKQDLTVGKLGAGTYYTGELEEDSFIPWAAELRKSLEDEGAEVLEALVIDGDTDASATTNINDIAGTPAATDWFLVLNGFRKLALVTNTGNARSGGALTVADYIETLKLMGLGGKNVFGTDRKAVAFIQDIHTNWIAMQLAEVLTQDVFAAPTIENGFLTNIWGRDVITTPNMHRANQDSTYGLKANTSGKIDLDTAANNTTGAILAVRFDQWRLGWKRMMKFETVRVPSADSTEITVTMRVGLIYRDTEASAISYGITAS